MLGPDQLREVMREAHSIHQRCQKTIRTRPEYEDLRAQLEELTVVDAAIDELTTARELIRKHAQQSRVIKRNRLKADRQVSRVRQKQSEINSLRAQRRRRLERIAKQYKIVREREEALKLYYEARHRLLVLLATSFRPELMIWRQLAGIDSVHEVWAYNDPHEVHLFYGGRCAPDGRGHGHAILKQQTGAGGGWHLDYHRHPGVPVTSRDEP